MQVKFLTKLVAQKPGKQVRDMIKNVMLGKDEGADRTDEEESKRGGRVSSGIAGRVSILVRLFTENNVIEIGTYYMFLTHCF